MNAFSEKFERVYRNLKDWRRNTEIEKSEYLEYAVKLWCKEVKIPQDIRSKINDSRNILTAFNKQWSNKRLINFFANNIQRSDIKGNETMSIYFFYTLIALMVIGVAYVIYQLNQPKSDDDLFETLEQDLSNEALQTIQKYRLILAIDPSKSSFLQNIKESNNFIRDESICENLFFATNYLWIGKESEDINSRKMNQSYKVEDENKKNFDVYILEIILDEYISGFEENVKKTKRLEAFDKLIDHKVTISERLSFEACSDLYSI